MTTFVGSGEAPCTFGDVKDDAVTGSEELIALGGDVAD